jgi:hypothetical protein
MGNNIFVYVQQLEMLAFFSGYPLVYYFVRLLSRNILLKNFPGGKLVSVLPFSYALMGTLFLCLQLKNLYPDYTIENLRHQIQQPWLIIWALLSILFWIPNLFKRQLLSILHGLFFFLIIVKDLFFQLTGSISDPDILRNDMKVYAISIALNISAIILLVLLSFLHAYLKKRR